MSATEFLDLFYFKELFSDYREINSILIFDAYSFNSLITFVIYSFFIIKSLFSSSNYVIFSFSVFRLQSSNFSI